MSPSSLLLCVVITCCVYLPLVDLIKASDKKPTKDYRERTDSLCILAPDVGPCKRLLKRWYWNSTANSCKLFTYGGCEGNLNRFDTKLECTTLCQAKYTKKDEDEAIKKVMATRARVNQKAELDKKRIEAKKRRLAKDKSQQGRERVVKNKHRKKKKKGNEEDGDKGSDKQKTTKSKIALEVPAICLLKPEQGGCDTPDRGKYWYYFDATTSKCFQFWYWGCGGNLNRFETNHKCLKKCVRSSEIRLKNHKRHCDKCDYKTSTCHKVSRGNFTCTCLEGFKKNSRGVCVDEDECLAHTADCSPYAWCENSIGSYRCVCMDGYRGTGKLCERIPFVNQVALPHQSSADVDECMGASPVCPAHSSCSNSIGSYSCECQIGFGGSGKSCSNDPAICTQPFDERYKIQCGTGKWTVKYYYDEASASCKQFWYDKCQLDSMNMFNDAHTCHALCARKLRRARDESSSSTTSSAVACRDEFDVSQMGQCQKATWTPRWYFDRRARRCQMFWYDESCAEQTAKRSASRNFFAQLLTCQWTCEKKVEEPQMQQPQPKHNRITNGNGNGNGHATIGKISASFSKKKERNRNNSSAPFIGVISASFSSTKDKHNRVVENGHGHSHRLGKISASLSSKSAVQRKSNAISFGRISAFLGQSPNVLEVKEKSVAVFDPIGILKVTKTDQVDTAKESLEHRPQGRVGRHGPGTEAVADNQIFSMRYKATITVAADCLDPFDDNLAKKCGNGQWQSRYYFDPDERKCRMYWFDNCKSHSRNNFGDLESCQWMCEGTHPKPEAKSCLDAFDETYKKDCRNGKFESRFYFDHDSKQCQLFWFGGCQSKSKNLFADAGVCQNLCETPNRDLSRSCLDPFDATYEQSCDSNSQQKYYFDIRSKSCKMFWYGNCKGSSENIYPSLATCQWLCERPKTLDPPKHCIDKFDEKYSQSCAGGNWIEKWYFDHTTGECQSFWFDQCKSSSENIFPDRKTCQWLCELPSPPYIAPSHLPDVCLEDVEAGTCGHTYPAFHYNRNTARCEPFSYTGCGGNRNRFLTKQQCDQTCEMFTNVNGHSADCLLPLDVGHSRKESRCQREAGYRFYYNRDYGKCGRFWYFGCGGNANRFNSDAVCRVACGQNHQLLESSKHNDPSVCFLVEDKGSCSYIPAKPEQRWSYNSLSRTCQEFTYNGCGGNRNRFGSKEACDLQCDKLKRPNSDQCAFWPDWGPCNQLRWMWYYNMTSGSCEQFLWGGCEGNTNRFTSFEICQRTCEIPSGSDPCLEKLDRGTWCQPMANRYFYDPKARKCTGFHYTGCGKSANNFLTLGECQDKCVFKSVTIVESSSNVTGGRYEGIKPPVKNEMKRHIFLANDAQSYLKTEAQWVDYGQCMGFRFNISGVFTKLTSYLCLMEENGHCMTEVFTDTKGVEQCKVVRPWLRGHHLYSWFFTVDKRPRNWVEYPVNDYQYRNETVASILLLGLNNCWNIC